MKVYSAICAILVFILQSEVNALDVDIFQTGDGTIRINGGKKAWDSNNSHPLSKNAKKKLQRVNPSDIRNIPPQALKTWEPEKFTDLGNTPKGKKLRKFRFLVHGLELKDFVEGLEEGSFDDFVKAKLWPDSPQGDDFIPYYPYFLFRKSVISASVVTENVTATFGEFGFILSAPSSHYLFGDSSDIHTPTDIQFYGTGSFLDGSSLGVFELKNRASRYPLKSLPTLLPPTPQERAPSQERRTVHRNQNAYKSSLESSFGDQEIIDMARRMTGREPSPQQIEKMRAHSAAQFAGMQPLFAAMGINSAAQNVNGTIEENKKTSSYNEIALVPFDPIKGTYVTISGLFLRCGKAEKQSFLAKPHIQKFLKMANDFDLPVVMIHDGTKYETNL